MSKYQTLVISPSDRRYNAENRRATVYILGWVGSQFRHLYSFAKIYERMGIGSIMYTFKPSTFHSLLPRKTVEAHAKGLLKELYNTNCDHQPVFFHLFSNGGSIMYYYLLKEIEKPENSHIKISGVVFDSCPSNFVSLEASSAYLKVMMVDQRFLTKTFGFCFCLGAYLNIGFNKCLDFISGETEGLENLYFARNTLTKKANQPRHYPHLFMYSKSDRIVSAEEVEKFIEDRERLGIRVSTNCWDKSDHCNHRKTYPKEYASILRKFIVDECFDKLPDKLEKPMVPLQSYNITGLTKIQAQGLTSKL